MKYSETTLAFISGLKCHWLHCGLSGKLNQVLRKKVFHNNNTDYYEP